MCERGGETVARVDAPDLGLDRIRLTQGGEKAIRNEALDHLDVDLSALCEHELAREQEQDGITDPRLLQDPSVRITALHSRIVARRRTSAIAPVQ